MAGITPYTEMMKSRFVVVLSVVAQATLLPRAFSQVLHGRFGDTNARAHCGTRPRMYCRPGSSSLCSSLVVVRRRGAQISARRPLVRLRRNQALAYMPLCSLARTPTRMLTCAPAASSPLPSYSLCRRMLSRATHFSDVSAMCPQASSVSVPASRTSTRKAEVAQPTAATRISGSTESGATRTSTPAPTPARIQHLRRKTCQGMVQAGRLVEHR